MDAKYPKRKSAFDVCLNCGFKLHSPAKNCPNCGKPMKSWKGEETLNSWNKKQKKKRVIKKIKSLLIHRNNKQLYVKVKKHTLFFLILQNSWQIIKKHFSYNITN